MMNHDVVDDAWPYSHGGCAGGAQAYGRAVQAPGSWLQRDVQ